MEKKRILKLIVTLCMLLAACGGTAFADSYPDVYVETPVPGVTGWNQVPSGEWKYLAAGTPLHGWADIGAFRYYFDRNGFIVLGWQEIDGAQYYFAEATADGRPKGSLYVSCSTPDGKWVDENGALTNKHNPYGHTCVEVDLTNQMVYVYQGEWQVLASPCVTGYKGVHDTTPGDWTILDKESDVYLTGPTWHSHVDFWMPFHGGMGLHDANWRGTSHSNFGGQIYKTDGSHGCVNLPHDVAEQLYAIAYVGMPVHVHY